MKKLILLAIILGAVVCAEAAPTINLVEELQAPTIEIIA